MKNRNFILKLALFATGLSGIVAEYILATLASYFLGDAVKQWTLIISLMLFFMGLGSRVTRHLSKDLFTWFVGIEFLLSVVVSFAALITYSCSAHSEYIGLLIYGLAVITGLLIGMELPLAIRLNEQFESLEINVATILEKDYYGSLLGGLFFAFIGLPYLGLTYTPFVLGFINLGVAIALLHFFPVAHQFSHKKKLNAIALVVIGIILAGLLSAQRIILFGEQKKYRDKVVYSEQSRYQKIVLTEWREDYWLYLDANLQFSSFDEPMYHEVLVHPAAILAKRPQEALILGGGDGCAARELLKHPSIQHITLVDIDPAITRLAKENAILQKLNQGALHNPKVTIHNKDGFLYLEKEKKYYDLIIIDLPDPRSVELSRLYSLEFYQLCLQQLRPQGLLITQAGSPYFAATSFQCIKKTMTAAGFSTLPMHNQIITMGEWGWILGTKKAYTKNQLIEQLKQANFEKIQTRWLNQSAINLITSFGKDFFTQAQKDTIQINRIHAPVLHHYYLNGQWDLY